MTAVAPPVNYQNINRQAWSAEGVPNGGGIFMPRKSAQRSNSSSSLSSQASTTSTISAASSSSSQPNSTASSNGSDWAATRKAKTPKGLWPATKTEPIAGITAARPQPIASVGPGSSAASAMSALQAPSAMVPSQHNGALQAAQQQPNGAQRTPAQESTAVLHLVPMNGTFERKTITVPFFPDVLRIGRQTNNKTIPTPLNGYFDSKVLSRQHAEVWADRQGKIWIRDVKSSNGTFVNGSRLSQENRDSDPHELREQDMLELGIDIVSEDQKTIVHHKVAARVEHAGIYSRSSSEMIDLNFGEMEGPQLSNIMGSTSQQQLANMRGRTPSQGSINGQRMQGPGAMANYQNGMQQPRHPNFWLQPITMEQVVKKLNNEIKAAKQQSQDLQQTHQYINAILTADTKKELTKTSPINQVRISPIKDNSLKARFSDPPAPPPQQPLPEKPDAASSLKRSDTERQKTASPVRSDAQLSSLTEALTNAKKEIESQGMRLRDLETLLNEERRAREDAEERAARLERETNKDHGDAETVVGDNDAEEAEAAGPEHEELTGSDNGSVPSDSTEDTTARLQQRLELMMSEMNEMKQQMERYRERAETAETDRKSLAEMIEKIRKDNAKTASNGTRRRSRSDSASEKISAQSGMNLGDSHESEEGEIVIIKEKDLDEDGPEASAPEPSRQNGHHVQHKDSKQSRNAESLVAQRLDRNPMYYGGPVGAMVAVVAIGVAVMTMLNQYPKAER
ncbi:FHA domain [Pyrenophora tritici-repentis]|uniref:FHA domain containing protein n=2 Tax=Pyrenophora tritici-repentis TaxID=45151 RepID=A0A2W1HQ19_9PLEO|nr:FHA domain protein [Pyrenophora tritici-repentis]KAF7444585.1 FHA domain protein [Pyrenophora tritici-repentis]KAF7564756.1 FHA domain protein [Pyrenophora tritici-repentis]KAG9378833.1 FHA domain protein [Pyrenophora tritici-repentis]KAI0578450.1 FHA domain protein [Pyrenophora tritici-repentis]